MALGRTGSVLTPNGNRLRLTRPGGSRQSDRSNLQDTGSLSRNPSIGPQPSTLEKDGLKEEGTTKNASGALLEGKRRALLNNHPRLPKIGGVLLGPADLGSTLTKPGTLAPRLRTADGEKGREVAGSSGALGHQPKVLRTNMPYKPLSSHNPGRQYHSDAAAGVPASVLPKRVEMMPNRRHETFQTVERGRANFFFEEANSNIFADIQKQSASFCKEEQEFTSASSGKNPHIAQFDSLKATAEKLEEFKFTLGNEQISSPGELQQSLALSATQSDQLNFTFGDISRELGKLGTKPSILIQERGILGSSFQIADQPNKEDSQPRMERIPVSKPNIGRGTSQPRDDSMADRIPRPDPVAPHSSPQKANPKLNLPPRLVVMKREPQPNQLPPEPSTRTSSRPLPSETPNPQRVSGLQAPKRPQLSSIPLGRPASREVTN